MHTILSNKIYSLIQVANKASPQTHIFVQQPSFRLEVKNKIKMLRNKMLNAFFNESLFKGFVERNSRFAQLFH